LILPHRAACCESSLAADRLASYWREGMATVRTPKDTAIEREAERWMNDPYEHFGHHNTRISTLCRAEEVQAISACSDEPQAARAARAGADAGQARRRAGDSTRFPASNGLAPLLMPHDIVQVIPQSLLAKQQFGKLNTWLTKLTRYSPRVDVSQCDSIDAG
jgi:hypothetical protein